MIGLSHVWISVYILAGSSMYQKLIWHLVQAGSRKKNKFIPWRMSPPFLRFRPVKFCTSSMCHCEDLTCRFFFFCLIFRRSRFFSKMWPTLDHFFSAKKKKEAPPRGGQASGWTCRTRLKKYKVCLFKTAWTFGLLCE